MKKSASPLWPVFVLLFSLILVQSCGDGKDSGELVHIKGYWGHLDEVEDSTPSHLFLAHVKPNETYTVCLAQYMVDRYPGIKNEIEASIDLWGHYIGRKFPITIDVKNIRPPRRNENPSAQRERFYQQCGKHYDLVVATSYLGGSTAGQTSSSMSYLGLDSQNRKRVQTFQRSLVLKESDAGDEKKINWITLERYLGKELSSAELLELMKKREVTAYLTGADDLLTLRTIIHEIGHVWGLCDQYVLGGPEKTNCDPEHSLINASNHIILVDDAIMSNSKKIAPTFLLDDDIEGIRKLAERDFFNHGWPTLNQYSDIEVPQTSKKLFEFASLNSTEQSTDKLILNLSLVTTVPVRFTFSLNDANNGDRWVRFGARESNQGLNWMPMVYTLNKPTNLSVAKVKLNLDLLAPNGDVLESKEFIWEVSNN